MGNMITLKLPFPVSVNAIWRAYKGRNIKTERYRIWQRAALNEAMAQRQTPIAGPVDVEIMLGRPSKRKMDVDNFCKGPLDILTHMGLIEDDSLIQRLTVSWCPSTEPKTATILVWPHEEREAA
jgi:crossover junction endodeoxyribonuclease RusA